MSKDKNLKDEELKNVTGGAQTAKGPGMSNPADGGSGTDPKIGKHDIAADGGGDPLQAGKPVKD